MSEAAKISRAFEPFLADSGPNDKRDAIVIFKPPAMEELPVRGRRRELKKRLAHIRKLTAVQQPVQESLLSGYQREAGKKLPAKEHLDVSTVGANALPVATVEVTRKTLRALAAQPDVVAVMPTRRST
jgi:hypothetical protein